MEQIRVRRMVNNIEIICKLMNSVAKQCGCRVKYNPHSGSLQFFGDPDCRKYVVEETLAYIRTS